MKEKLKNATTSRSEFLKTTAYGIAGLGLSFAPFRKFISKGEQREGKIVEVTLNEFAVKRNNKKG